MEEYSRIVIERWCRTHRKTKKNLFLQRMVELSYSPYSQPGDYEAVMLEQYISKERDPELRDAMIDMDNYFFSW